MLDGPGGSVPEPGESRPGAAPTVAAPTVAALRRMIADQTPVLTGPTLH